MLLKNHLICALVIVLISAVTLAAQGHQNERCEPCPEGEQTLEGPELIVISSPETAKRNCQDVRIERKDPPKKDNGPNEEEPTEDPTVTCKHYEGEWPDRDVVSTTTYDGKTKKVTTTPEGKRPPNMCRGRSFGPNRSAAEYARLGLAVSDSASLLRDAAAEVLNNAKVCTCDEVECDADRSCRLDEPRIDVNGGVYLVTTKWEGNACIMQIAVDSIDYECNGGCKEGTEEAEPVALF